MTDLARQHHWEAIARRWSHVGYPLRPCPEDSESFFRLLDLPDRAPLKVLILGVTPELFRLPWPAGSTVQAADRSLEMIHAIWPGPPETACTANWLDLPFPAESFGCILCDGGLHLLEGVEAQRALSGAISGLLKKDGQFVVRLFAQPPQTEEPQTILAELETGRIPNMHIFKLRMAMALQPSFETGIVLSEVYERIMQEFGDPDEIARLTQWPRDEVFTLTSYQHSRNRYHFTTEAGSIDVLHSSGGMILDRRQESYYPLGERCPVLSFRKV